MYTTRIEHILWCILLRFLRSCWTVARGYRETRLNSLLRLHCRRLKYAFVPSILNDRWAIGETPVANRGTISKSSFDDGATVYTFAIFTVTRTDRIVVSLSTKLKPRVHGTLPKSNYRSKKKKCKAVCACAVSSREASISCEQSVSSPRPPLSFRALRNETK